MCLWKGPYTPVLLGIVSPEWFRCKYSPNYIGERGNNWEMGIYSEEKKCSTCINVNIIHICYEGQILVIIFYQAQELQSIFSVIPKSRIVVHFLFMSFRYKQANPRLRRCGCTSVS